MIENNFDKKANMSFIKIIGLTIVAIIIILVTASYVNFGEDTRTGLNNVTGYADKQKCELFGGDYCKEFEPKNCDENDCSDEEKEAWEKYQELLEKQQAESGTEIVESLPEPEYTLTGNLKLSDNLHSDVKKTIDNLKNIKISVFKDAYEYAVERSKSEGINPYLTLTIITIETKGDEDGLSFTGAAGLMQLMPDTARSMGISVPTYNEVAVVCYNSKGVVYYNSSKSSIKTIAKCNTCDVGKYGNRIYKIGGSASECDLENDERFFAAKNIDAGVAYLKTLKASSLTKTDSDIAAGYNGGLGALKMSKDCEGQKIYECEKNTNYAETRNYVVKYNKYVESMIS